MREIPFEFSEAHSGLCLKCELPECQETSAKCIMRQAYNRYRPIGTGKVRVQLEPETERQIRLAASEGRGMRAIASAHGISRDVVRRVLNQ